MRTLVVYYSLEGNTRFIAETIARSINGDILELKPEKDVPSKGFLKFILGGKQAVFKERPKLKNLEKNIEDYDVIFLGSPVWAGTFAPAFNTLFSKMKIENKKVALFGCYGGQSGKIFENFKKYLTKSTVVGEIGFKDPLKNDKELNENRVEKWTKNIVNKLQS
ncbi:flavodoxin [Clostridium sp. P21]|uniref:Flavodoxin n=1 Tax=Clostridium muellerianum TaxID=2716538 RepID=A0A7Y0HMU1_9CLOT|nr:flavodoxin [Clostridium muellerianum]NMM62520.1 flavodoxin [Clostridium muellerianum]